jgi:hypothetical protein
MSASAEYARGVVMPHTRILFLTGAIALLLSGCVASPKKPNPGPAEPPPLVRAIPDEVLGFHFGATSLTELEALGLQHRYELRQEMTEIGNWWIGLQDAPILGEWHVKEVQITPISQQVYKITAQKFYRELPTGLMCRQDYTLIQDKLTSKYPSLKRLVYARGDSDVKMIDQTLCEGDKPSFFGDKLGRGRCIYMICIEQNGGGSMLEISYREDSDRITFAQMAQEHRDYLTANAPDTFKDEKF